jgi:MarR family transcriptional regulator, temperature-dependent positive regulator of motility
MRKRIENSPPRTFASARSRKLVTFERGTPPVHRVPAPLARRFDQICVSTLAQALAGENLQPLEFAVLRYVDEEPGIDQSGLCERLGIDRNTTSLLVNRLESNGLVARRVNGDDRRARLLYLTPGGKRLHDRVRPKTFAGWQRMLSVLKPAERELLLDLLVRLIEGNRILARPGAGRRKRSQQQHRQAQ